ncbi:MAG: VWA domain-containing protein [Polyangiaceae bacterium]|nr:VWA domain-containing protein [Polyangiaceae bacterium]
MKQARVGWVFVAAVVLAGCSSSADTSNLSADKVSGGDRGAASSGGGDVALGVPSADSSGGVPSSQGNGASAGQLTAGVWDDNLNYDFFQKYLNNALQLPGLPIYSMTERDIAHDLYLDAPRAQTELDLAFLFDTTGSMGDELSYLQNEIEGIVSSLHTTFPSVTPRLGLALYRDHGDVYVTKGVDFTTDVGAFHQSLAAQSADGGGDYEEAVPEGLQQVAALNWRTGNVARMIFWMADAPAHENDAQNVRLALDAVSQKNLHLYPVAASGADDRLEYTMRSAAQITGGRYLFLTNDSGIGNDHMEPHIPCYQVTLFSSAIVRMISGELSGTHVEPQSSEIIRTVGNPQDGTCILSDDSQVSLY